MVRPRIRLEAPPVTPLPFGLLSAAIVRDDLEGHARLGGYYESESCGVAHATRAACEAGVDFDQVEEGVDWTDVDPFTLYSIFRCNLVGGAGLIEQRARDNLRLGEQRGLEEATAAALALRAGAVDLTPAAGAQHPDDGLALLEGWAGKNYGGTPTIHVPRQVGALLERLVRNGTRLETQQGSPVASGGGYHDLGGPAVTAPPEDDPEGTPVPTPVAAGPGEAWMYVTGQVVVRRSGVVEATPLVTSRRPATNVGLVLAERPYAVSWDCITAAVLVRASRTPEPV